MVGSARSSPLVAVIGQGYVGLPLAIRAVEVGFDVVGFDTDLGKVGHLQRGRSYIDDVTDHDVSAALDTGRFRATDAAEDVAGFDIAVITVPTPLRDGTPDLSYVESAVDVVGAGLVAGSSVVLESTTYPGTTDELVAGGLQRVSGLRPGVDFHLGYSPERIDPGNQVWDFVRTPKVVSGLTRDCLDSVQRFYDCLVDKTVPVSNTRAAELTKLLENTFRHVNIALVNELAIHARALGIDIWEVIEAASTKPFGYTPFWPGPGVGGHCLPIDPSYLSWRIEQQLGSTSRFVEIANDVNKQMPAYVVRRIQLGLNRQRRAVNGARVIVVGLAYKKNSNDARESPATGVIEGLLELGADVRVHDDHVGGHPIDNRAPRVSLSHAELLAAEAVVLVTDHDGIDFEALSSVPRYVLDTRNRLSGEPVERL